MHLQINLQIAIYEKSLKLLNEPTLQMIDDSNSAPFWRKKKRKKDIKMLHIEVFKTSFKNIYKTGGAILLQIGLYIHLLFVF